MQKTYSFTLDDIFVKQLGVSYDKSIDNRCCLLCIVNIMKYFVSDTLPNSIIKQYRAEVLTFTGSNVDKGITLLTTQSH